MHWQSLSLLALAIPVCGALSSNSTYVKSCISSFFSQCAHNEKQLTIEHIRSWAVVLYDSCDVLDVAGFVELLMLLASTLGRGRQYMDIFGRDVGN